MPTKMNSDSAILYATPDGELIGPIREVTLTEEPPCCRLCADYFDLGVEDTPIPPDCTGICTLMDEPVHRDYVCDVFDAAAD